MPVIAINAPLEGKKLREVGDFHKTTQLLDTRPVFTATT
jgi:hypothetical protein